jgi:type II secretory pathway component HofQ
MVSGVAQANFSADIPPASPESAFDDEIPETKMTMPLSQGPNGTQAVSGSELVGVSAGVSPTATISSKKAIRLDFRDAPVSQVIRMIANESGINFIISPEAGTKKTSISLKNVPWDVALRAVLESNRLGMQEIAPGLVRIDYLKVFSDDKDAEERARQSTEALVPTKVLVMPLNYAKAEDAAKIAASMLPKVTDPQNVAQKRNFERFKAQADIRSNAVIVEATPNVLATIKALLERLDAQTPQVRIASRLVEVTNDIFDGLGVAWGAPLNMDPGRGLSFGSLPFPNNMTSQFSVDPGGGTNYPGGSAAVKFGSLNNMIALDLKLKFYETKRKAETLQTQDVVVQDNEKAMVSAGSTDFFQTSAGIG